MQTLIRYLKTRALRQITQWLIISACSIIILGTLAVADAYAQSSETYICKDLAGSTAGTCSIDKGCLDFDVVDPPSASFKAEICGPEEAFEGDDLRDFELHGWVWNPNLGYVSLYCDATGQNNGANCGSIPYGVKINASTGKISGWAWNDNIGWISFACKDGFNQGYACGSINYETSIDLKIGDTLGKIKGYAWSDAVGWFDFQTGDAGALLLDLIMRESESATEWGVWTKAQTEGSGTPPTKDSMPIAGSGDGYDIFVHVATIDESPLQGGAYLTITPLWKDSVGYNQADSSTANHDINNDGPVKKPALVFDKEKLTEEGVGNSHYGTVISQMPTDGGNCYDGDDDGFCTESGEGDFFYRNFGGATAPENSLTYLGSTVTISIPATGDYWSTTVRPLGYTSGWKMDFLPQIDIPVFDYLMIPGDIGPESALPFIQAIRNKVDEFYVQGKKYLDVAHDVTFELSSSDPTVKYVFVDSLTDEENPESKNTRFTTTIDGLVNSLYGLPYAPTEDALDEFVPGAMIRSVISINGVGSYFSNGLPRIDDSNVQTQVAEIISGSVFSPGAKEVVKTSDVPLFGDVTVYQLRTQVLSDVSSLMRGIVLSESLLSSITIGAGGDDIENNTFKDGRLFYFENQDVIIKDVSVLSDASGGKPTTVVVKGGDLYIENNVDIPDQEFGFIVFESDTAVDGPATTKGGRIYVHSDVTDMVNVHIFADGPVFRYTDGICYFWDNYGASLVGLREPNFVKSGRCSVGGGGGGDDFKEPLSALVNQFYLKGNIASFNCLGCSTSLNPSRGDGLLLGGPSALNFAIARLYDFNYFSYYRLHPITGVPSGAESTNISQMVIDGKLTAEKGKKAVHFEYSPAPTDLMGFRNF